MPLEEITMTSLAIIIKPQIRIKFITINSNPSFENPNLIMQTILPHEDTSKTSFLGYFQSLILLITRDFHNDRRAQLAQKSYDQIRSSLFPLGFFAHHYSLLLDCYFLLHYLLPLKKFFKNKECDTDEQRITV